MEQNLKKIGLIDLIVLLAIGAAGAALARYSNTHTGIVGMCFLGIGILALAVSYFQMRLEETERLEKLEFDEINRDKAAASLFNTVDSEVFPAKRSREQFERFFVPVFTVIVFILQAAAVIGLWKWLQTPASTVLQKPTVAMSLFGLFALVLFLLGKYSAGIARLEGARLLRPGASYVLMGAYICFIVAGSIAAVQLGFPQVDIYAAKFLVIVLGLTAAETLINLILEIYRPRVKGKPARVLYESRVIGLMAQPEGLVTTAAQALDYQFGFKVSDTWFYRFLERALGWIILLQVVVLLLSTCVVFISPGEQALLERFGTPVNNRQILEPGIHFKYPWPVDRVFRARTREIQSLNIGFVPDKDAHSETSVLWTVKHFEEEFNMLVASRQAGGTNTQGSAPVDLLTVSIPVQYQIKDLHAWFYNHTDAGQILEKLAAREVVRFLVGVDMFDIMSKTRADAGEELRKRIQERADEFKLGVHVLFVGLQDVHPPVKVAKDFQAVISARQENEARLHEARGYATRVTLLAAGEAAKRVHEAEAYKARKIADAQARAGRFSGQMAAYQASPALFGHRTYLAALEQGMTNARKYVVAATNTQDVMIFNLEDKIRTDLLDVPLPGARR